MSDRSTKNAWLKQGAGDLETSVVEDVPVPGKSVLVRALPAAYSNQAQSDALEVVADKRGRQTTRVNTQRMECVQFAHGVVDPEFTLAEAQQVAEAFGPAFKKVIATIDRLSGLDKEAIEDANARFQSGEES